MPKHIKLDPKNTYILHTDMMNQNWYKIKVDSKMYIPKFDIHLPMVVLHLIDEDHKTKQHFYLTQEVIGDSSFDISTLTGEAYFYFTYKGLYHVYGYVEL